jgi:hypothetical protein
MTHMTTNILRHWCFACISICGRLSCNLDKQWPSYQKYDTAVPLCLITVRLYLYFKRVLRSANFVGYVGN